MLREQISEGELPREKFWRLVIPGRACPGLGLWTSQSSATGSHHFLPAPKKVCSQSTSKHSLEPSTWLWAPVVSSLPQSLESKVLCEASPFLQTHVEMTFQGGRNRLSVRKLSTVAFMGDTVHISSLFLWVLKMKSILFIWMRMVPC